MAKKFGGYVMKINNIGSFAEKVSKAVGAESWQVRKVAYTDYKAELNYLVFPEMTPLLV